MTELGAVQSVASISRDTSAASTGAAGAAGASPPIDFATMVAQMAGQTADTVRSAEAASQAGIKGHMPLTEVVDKVLEAERTLNSAIAVRDKVVSAYLELSRMQI